MQPTAAAAARTRTIVEEQVCEWWVQLVELHMSEPSVRITLRGNTSAHSGRCSAIPSQPLFSNFFLNYFLKMPPAVPSYCRSLLGTFALNKCFQDAPPGYGTALANAAHDVRHPPPVPHGQVIWPSHCDRRPPRAHLRPLRILLCRSHWGSSVESHNQSVSVAPLGPARRPASPLWRWRCSADAAGYSMCLIIVLYAIFRQYRPCVCFDETNQCMGHVEPPLLDLT